MWCHWQGKGRSWYTEMGHTKESYTEKPYLDMLFGGLMWAAQGSRRPDGAVDYLEKNNGYGNCYIHAEFKAGKSMSLITLGGKNRIALRDSQSVAWNQLSSDDCGGTNGHAPTTNASAGEANWNTVDAIISPSTNRIAEVRINGIVVQRNVETDGKLGRISLMAPPSSFRNVWVKKLPN